MQPIRIAREILDVFRKNWTVFLGIHLSAGIISTFALTPLYTLLTGWLILVSGDPALSDEDILVFALSPAGLLVMLVIGGLFATLLVFEQAALLVAGFRILEGREVSGPELGRYLLERAWPLFLLGLRMVGLTMLVAAPFLAVAALIFLRTLTEFDINYYLAEKTPVLWWAGSAIALVLAAMAWALMRVVAGWIVALPMLLVDRESPRRAMVRSREVARHIRKPIGLALAAWLALNAALLAVAGGLLNLGVYVARLIAGDSLQTMAYMMGVVHVGRLLANLAVTFFTSTGLGLGIVQLYRHLFPGVGSGELDARLAPPPAWRSMKVSGAALAALFFIASLGAGSLLIKVLEKADPGDGAEIIAHRGASVDAPENTLAAVKEAIRQGADWVEIDVQKTREGEIVVIHDRDLMKVGGSPLRVWDAPLSELQSVDIGSWMHAKFSAERVPTLRQLLQLCKGRIKVNIELKYYGQELRFEERVVEIVESEGMQDDVVAMSLSYRGVLRLKSLRPRWRVGLLSSVGIGDLTRLEADFFAINGQSVTRSFIRRARERDRHVLAWTINDPLEMSAMMSRGVDGIITDKPGLAREIRKRRAELDLHERFMIQFASLVGGRVKPVQ